MGSLLIVPNAFDGFTKELMSNQTDLTPFEAYDLLEEIIMDGGKQTVRYFLPFIKYEKIREAIKAESTREGNTVSFFYKGKAFVRQPKSNIL